MPSPRIAKNIPKSQPIREREGMSGEHRKMVKKLRCIVCGIKRPEGIDGHHLKRGLDPSERGMSRKASDQWLVPVCRKHHDDVEDVGDDDAWFAERGIDGRATARSLWAARGDADAMLRIVERSLLTRGVYGNV